MDMKRFCCLVSVLLLGGCTTYYRVVNGIAGEGEAWRKVGVVQLIDLSLFVIILDARPRQNFL